MSFKNVSDHFILQMYDSIREQVRNDVLSGIHLVGQLGRERAEELRAELTRRGLFFTPIDWPEQKNDAC